MKKFLAFCLALIMTFLLGTVAFAAPGSFVQSPSRNDGPTLVEGDNESADCEADLVVTPYKDRKDLPEKALQHTEQNRFPEKAYRYPYADFEKVPTIGLR